MDRPAWPQELSLWIGTLAQLLDARIAHRLPLLLRGLLFAQGRRTVSCWLRAAGVGHQFRPYYYFVGSLGRNAPRVARQLLGIVLNRIAPGERLLLGLDDSPTKRAGPHVEGAGIHHNPTPGAAGAKFLYGHVWVTLAWLTRHPTWGAIALPLLARLYIRARDLGGIAPWNRPAFQTKLQQAADLVDWAVTALRWTGKSLWVVADGAYAKRPFLKRALAAGVVVVSRLRRDAALFDLPPQPKRRGRGQPRKYGRHRISLAKRAAHRQGWTTAEFVLYGRTVTKTFKTFLATWRPAGGVIRVVLVKEAHGWAAFFATSAQASVADILEAVADRAALEQTFHDIKEVHGAGEQQVRHVWANIAAWHLTLWLHTLVELWAWDQPQAQLCDRSASPWDDPTRRPSHADRLKALRRQCLRAEFSATTVDRPIPRKFRQLFQRVVSLVV